VSATSIFRLTVSVGLPAIAAGFRMGIIAMPSKISQDDEMTLQMEFHAKIRKIWSYDHGPGVSHEELLERTRSAILEDLAARFRLAFGEKTAEEKNPGSAKKRTASEQRIIDWMERDVGRKLTPAEEEWCLAQARVLREI
jgi:hypothetical protein